MTRKRYADTLEQIAEKGADAFYSGSMAEATIYAQTKSNGTMTLADLQDYTVKTREPLEVSYRGHKLTSCSAPSSGAVVLSVMKAVEGYNSMGYDKNINTHRLDEAIKFA